MWQRRLHPLLLTACDFTYAGTGASWTVDSLQMAVSAQRRAGGKTAPWHPEQLPHHVALGHGRAGRCEQKHICSSCGPEGPRLTGRAGQISLTTFLTWNFPSLKGTEGSGCRESTGSIGWATIPSLTAQGTAHAILKASRTANTAEIQQTSLCNRRTANDHMGPFIAWTPTKLLASPTSWLSSMETLECL